jgi:hypothetical protein
MMTTKSSRLCAESVPKAQQERSEEHTVETMERRGTILAAVVAAVSLSWGAAAAATTTSGLRGLVERSPIRPVCAADDPCSAPATDTLLTFVRGGYRSVTTRTSREGRYRVALAPGTWTVRTTAASKIGSGIAPRSVRVYAGRFRVVDFVIDTGIR